ncbi:hypothetical protein CGCVW01_v004568 [Colletotrichum viniferum]|nr:hypothetical protein CGCVW01_v004568 [Colletotrichum viniferum]
MAFALSSLESPSVSAALIWILGAAGIDWDASIIEDGNNTIGWTGSPYQSLVSQSQTVHPTHPPGEPSPRLGMFGSPQSLFSIKIQAASTNFICVQLPPTPPQLPPTFFIISPG